ncbi:stage III sporulation protein AF [Desnuesiella massiliensis]|uniref:stage III sporulation protein AF n=1 Tax=Desnuesiella massiliensis TaxID=1650662 RepID=UPI0006E419B6|nr:stage III sporulation protein AF [Desnuesiella massiliensis]
MVMLRQWVINVCISAFFITAIEIILPDNTLKKYSKFVLGLILIVVISNPLLSLFSKDTSSIKEAIINNANSLNNLTESKKSDEYKKKNIELTLKNFETNIQSNCLVILKSKFPEHDFIVQAKASYESNKYSIKNLDIGVKDKRVETVKKVEIKTNSNNEDNRTYDKSYSEIAQFLSKELNINKETITLYKINNK